MGAKGWFLKQCFANFMQKGPVIFYKHGNKVDVSFDL